MLLVPLALLSRIMHVGKQTIHRLRISTWLIFLFIWLSWIILLTISSSNNVNWIGIYGVTRLVALSLIFFSIRWTEKDIINSQWIFVISAIPVGLLSIGQLLGLKWAMYITRLAYLPYSSVVFEEQEWFSVTREDIFRGLGVFGNVSPAGTFFGLVIGINLFLITINRDISFKRSILYSTLFFAFFGGFSTLSGTFIGIALIVPFLTFLTVPNINRRSLIKPISFYIIFFLFLGSFLVFQNENVMSHVQYQIKGLLTGERFQSRYGIEGVTHDAWQYVLKNPVQGAGIIETDIFSGDSLYTFLLFTGGFLGFLLFMIPLIGILKIGLYNNIIARIATLWTLCILITGVSSNGMFIVRLGDWWWAMQGMFLSFYGSSAEFKGNIKAAIEHKDSFKIGDHPIRKPCKMEVVQREIILRGGTEWRSSIS